MTIRAVLATKPPGEVVTIGPDALVLEAARLLSRHRIGALPVVDSGRLVGILSERDIVRGLVHSPDIARTGRVRALMTADLFLTRPEDGVDSALRLMSEKRIRHLPVVDGQGALVGIVTLGDLAWAREQPGACPP